MYRRVMPRDLFNESKLLKCLGQLALLIHRGQLPQLEMTHLKPLAGFVIHQCPGSGDLYCVNMQYRLGGAWVEFRSGCNSQEPYPLLLVLPDESELEVFNPDGTLHADFLDYLATNCKEPADVA